MTPFKSVRLVLLAAFALLALALGYAGRQYYRQLVQSRLLSAQYQDQRLLQETVVGLQTRWQEYFREIQDRSLRVLAAPGNSLQENLRLLQASQAGLRQALYADRGAVFLPGLKLSRLAEPAEDLSLEWAENPDFKQAETAEFKDADFARAISLYERLWLDQPGNYLAANALARCLFKAGEYARSDRIYRHLYQQNPPQTLQGETPLAVIAGFQIISLAETQGDTPSAAAFSLEFYRDLLSGRWELTKSKRAFFDKKLLAAVQPFFSAPAFQRAFGRLRREARGLEADQAYIRFVARQVLPFIENQPAAGFYAYRLTPPGRSPALFLAFRHAEGHLVLEYDYPAFVLQALQPALLTLGANPSFGATLRCAGSEFAWGLQGPGRSAAVTLVPSLPELSLAIRFGGSAETSSGAAAWQRRTGWLLFAGYLLALLIAGLGLALILKQLQFAELKSEFVSQVSHELKTPMTSLRMFSELLNSHNRLPSRKRRQYHAIMLDETARLSRLIENLLGLSRIERRKSQYHFSAQNLDQTLRAAARVFASSLGAEKRRLRVSLHTDLVLWADPDALSQMTLNLLDNARKFSPDGAPIALASRKEGGDALITVQDQGRGMARSELRRVFRKFYQAGGPSRGIGLGLAIVRHIVQAHGGRIQIESELGCGTTVTITLPCRSPQTDPAGNPEKKKRLRPNAGPQGERHVHAADHRG